MPIPVRKEITQLGHDIRVARKFRKLPMTILAERARISRITLAKVERGNPQVSIGIYASVLNGLGMGGGFAALAGGGKDWVGRLLVEEDLPKRIRRKGSK